MKKTLQSTTKVRFQDADPFNHLNNSKYVDYFINAREDQILHHYGLDIFELAKTTGQSWVVGSNQIAYFKPAYTMEEILIESELIHYTNHLLIAEMTMWDKQRKVLKSIIWSKFICYNFHTQKMAEHAPEHMELFAKIAVKKEQSTFEDRTNAVIMQSKMTN